MRISIILAALTAVIAIGVGAYFFLSSSSGPKIATYFGQQKPALRDNYALTKPEEGAEIAARLSAGMPVDVVGVLEGGSWAQITLPDKRIAYFPASDLGLAKSEAPAQAQSSLVDDVPVVEFEPTSDVYTANKSVAVYLEPNVHAPKRYQIDVGTTVPAVAVSKDGTWIRASTEDGHPAFLLVAELSGRQKGRSVMVPQDEGRGSDTIDGAAKVLTTGSIEVGGQNVLLSGIIGDDSSAAVQQLQLFIDSQGGNLHCARQDSGYLCKLPTGIDVALNVLYNGLARPTDGAPAAYQSQAKAAKAAGRGLWHS